MWSCCGDLRQKVIDISAPQCNCGVAWTDLNSSIAELVTWHRSIALTLQKLLYRHTGNRALTIQLARRHTQLNSACIATAAETNFPAEEWYTNNLNHGIIAKRPLKLPTKYKHYRVDLCKRLRFTTRQKQKRWKGFYTCACQANTTSWALYNFVSPFSYP